MDASGTPSPEELLLVRLLAKGETDEAIARRLGLTRRTLQRRLRDVLEKLGARSRFQAGVLAERLGWVRADRAQLRHPNEEDPRGRPAK